MMGGRELAVKNADFCIREMWIKTTEIPLHTCQKDYHQKEHNKCCQECREKGNLVHCWWECKLLQPLRKTAWILLKTPKRELPLWPSKSIPRYTSKTSENTNSKKKYIPQCPQQQYLQLPICGSNLRPSTGKWIKQIWYLYLMEYYSAIKKNKILPFAATWTDWEGIALCEISQTEKDKYFAYHLCVES